MMNSKHAHDSVINHEKSDKPVTAPPNNAVNKSNIVSWKAAEYAFRERGLHWYWITIIIAAILFLVAVKQRNFFFGVFVIVGTILLCIMYSRKPTEFEFVLSEKHIEINGRIAYRFDEFVSFAVRDNEFKHNHLILKKKKKLGGLVRLPLSTAATDVVKTKLKTKLKEVEYEETVSDIIEDMLGF